MWSFSVLLLCVECAAADSVSLTRNRKPLTGAVLKYKGGCNSQAVLSEALQLRGGDGGSMVQSMQNSYFGIPVVTRTWFSMILVFAGLSQASLLQPEMVELDAYKIVKKLQLWRPLTAASFFGGVGPQLLQKLYYLVSFGQQLELTLGIGEYMRVVASCIAMLSFSFHILGWKFLGDGLIMAITVLCAQQNPNAQMNMYGFKFPYQFLPFAQLAMSYMFTQQIPWPDIGGLVVGYVHYHINDQLKPDEAIAAKTPSLAKSRPRAGGGSKSSGGSKRKPGGRKQKIATIQSHCPPGG